MVGFMDKALGLFGIKKDATAPHSEFVGGPSVEEFLSELPQRLGYDVQFKRTERSEPGNFFEVEGTEVDSLLAIPGILDALSHLCMRVQRRTLGVANAPGSDDPAEFRIIFDANGFRDRKIEELRALAADKRQKVIDSGGKPAYIPALGPSERKVIHTHLADLGEVTSESIGRGNFKRIRVKLKEGSEFYREPQPRDLSNDEESFGNAVGALQGATEVVGAVAEVVGAVAEVVGAVANSVAWASGMDKSETN